MVVFAVMLPVPAPAREADRQAELEAIRDQIMGLQGRLSRVRQEARGLRGELAQTELAMELQRARLAEARAARALAEESLSNLEREIVDLEARLQQIHARLRRRLVDLHRLGQQGYLRLLVSIRSSDDFLPGIRQLRYAVKRDGGLLDSYLESHAELDFKREEASRHHEQVARWLASETSRLEQLREIERQQARLLTRLEQEDAELSLQAARLTDKERKLASLLEFLYGKTTGSLAGTPVQQFQGVLDWPVTGRVVRGFGPRLDPRYRTRVPHNGIELSVPVDSEIRTVFPGRVLYAAPLQGYGLTAVVHHPGRVFSLYAGIKELRTRRDDMLSLGEVIGLSAASLYFEIRVENRPVDPARWLR